MEPILYLDSWFLIGQYSLLLTSVTVESAFIHIVSVQCRLIDSDIDRFSFCVNWEIISSFRLPLLKEKMVQLNNLLHIGIYLSNIGDIYAEELWESSS